MDVKGVDNLKFVLRVLNQVCFFSWFYMSRIDG